MSFFSSSADKYSQVEHPLAEFDLKNLVSRLKVNTLTQQEEKLIESALMIRRGSDGKISLRQIYEVLIKLKNEHLISIQDEESIMKVFQDYFLKKFPA